MATAEFSKFAGILSAALSQHHLKMRLEVDQLAEITKTFSPTERREESPGTCHASRVSLKQVESILRFQQYRLEEREEKQTGQDGAWGNSSMAKRRLGLPL